MFKGKKLEKLLEYVANFENSKNFLIEQINQG